MKQIKKSKTEKKETGILDEIRGLGVMIERLNSNVGRLLKKMKEKS